MQNEVFTLIDILGTAAFAISGVFAAMEKRLDIFGIFIIAFITAIGGGTIRDILIGNFPVTWMRSRDYSIVIFASAFIAIFFYKLIRDYDKILLVFDSIGLGFFAILGLQKGLEFNFPPGMCIALGTISACFGGMVRDIVLNQIPHIFHKELYATVCIAGGGLYFLLSNTGLDPGVLQGICIGFIVILRLLAVRYNWTLPAVY